MRSFPSLIILAGLFLPLYGCKATLEKAAPTASPTPTASATPPAGKPVSSTPGSVSVKDDRPLIVCFGDSLTAGYGAEDGQSYPDYLQQDLDRDGYHYRVVNEGVSGNTTKDGVDRLAEVTALHPAVVLLEFGGNDGLRGLPLAITRSNLARMIAGLKSSGTRVVLLGITLPPDFGPDYVTKFTNIYPALAKQYGLPVLPFLLKNVYGVPGMMQADNIHATGQGNAIVAKNVLPLVEPALHK